MWKASTTAQSPWLGRAVSGAVVETRHGHTTLQLQFSKYSPLSCHCAAMSASYVGYRAIVTGAGSRGQCIHPSSLRRFEGGAEAGHQWHEIGKARGDRAGFVDRDRLIGGEAQNQKGHRDAMVELGGNPRAAGREIAGALDDQIVALDSDANAASGQAGRDAGEPVAFLD